MESNIAPYNKQVELPSNAIPMALVVIYTLVICSLTILFVTNSSHQHTQRESLEQLEGAVRDNNEMLTKMIKDKQKTDVFLDELKRQGVDVKSLVPEKK